MKPKTTVKELGTFTGSFIPSVLGTLSIFIFFKFGVVIDNIGIVGIIFLLILTYTVSLITLLSVCAISTNGRIKQGTPYYIISQSLGPEFGAAIGILFATIQILDSALNIKGIVEILMFNFSKINGDVLQLLPEGYKWQMIYCTLLSFFSVGIVIFYQPIINRISNKMFYCLLISILSIPVSTFFVKPFKPVIGSDLEYSGLSVETFKQNLWPKFISEKNSIDLLRSNKRLFKSFFGIIFASTADIFSSLLQSNNLKFPSKSIVKGSIFGQFFTLFIHIMVLLFMAGSIPRNLFALEHNILHLVNTNKFFILTGEILLSIHTTLQGLDSAFLMIISLSEKKIIFGLHFFDYYHQYLSKRELNILLIMFVTTVIEFFFFTKLNQIAILTTMVYLLTYIMINISCLLLKIISAPNFRPSFKYFNSKTSFLGVIMSLIFMFIIDRANAILSLFITSGLIIMLHYNASPQLYGDIFQLILYHQVRKYLLRLKHDLSVECWRPQILLLCNNIHSSFNLIKFCNQLKKGGLYLIGHTQLFNEKDQESLNEQKVYSEHYEKAQLKIKSWNEIFITHKIKAFVQIQLEKSLVWGIRNIFLSSGLGGLKPNIVILGFFNMAKSQTLNDQKDSPKKKLFSINQWVETVEDLILTMQTSIGIAANFEKMDVPTFHSRTTLSKNKNNSTKNAKFLDLYLIKIFGISNLNNGTSVVSSNFDTFTLILQLGYIISTVGDWRYSGHTIRVISLVEYQKDVEQEKQRIKQLLDTLRIKFLVEVFHLHGGTLSSYNFIVSGHQKNDDNKLDFEKINDVLKNCSWWTDLCKIRNQVKIFEKNKIHFSENSDFLSTPCEFDFPLNLKFQSSKQLKLSFNKKKSKKNTSFLYGAKKHNSFFTADHNTVFYNNTPYSETDDKIINDENNLKLSFKKNNTVLNILKKFVSNAFPKIFHNLNYKKLSDNNSLKLPLFEYRSLLNKKLTSEFASYKKKYLSQIVPLDNNTFTPLVQNHSLQFVLHPQFVASDSINKKIIVKKNSPRVNNSNNLSERRLESNSFQELLLDLKNLKFEDLPKKGKFLIFNELMKTKSPSSKTALIFTTLPIPYHKTHLNDDASREYVEDLSIWFNSLVPVIMFNSQTVTVSNCI